MSSSKKIFVSATGDDSNDGSTLSLAKATYTSARTIANRGDQIVLYGMNLNYSILLKDGVDIDFVNSHINLPVESSYPAIYQTSTANCRVTGFPKINSVAESAHSVVIDHGSNVYIEVSEITSTGVDQAAFYALGGTVILNCLGSISSSGYDTVIAGSNQLTIKAASIINTSSDADSEAIELATGFCCIEADYIEKLSGGPAIETSENPLSTVCTIKNAIIRGGVKV
ncbi:MAG: hypothetical protein ACRC78_26010, partial [Planktothrix sp.]